jgi:ABC-type lipoprotein export system ATPase subunit
MIEAMNEASPAVFVLMDYWTFDGWLALKARQSEPGSPKLLKKVFPGIELRLVSPTSYRLNAHVVFADDISDQDLHNFKSNLNVALINQPLSDECLVRLTKDKLGADLLSKNGYKKAEIVNDDSKCLEVGSKAAEISPESYKSAIAKVPGGKAIGFMPWDTNDGLARADWTTHYAYVLELMKTSPIFETRRSELWAAFVGVRCDENKAWFEPFQSALDNIPRLAVSGSDAHNYGSYGKFPSGMGTWIKADPTFLGLLQAIKEPAKRSFIGEQPTKLLDIAANKTFFVDSVHIDKHSGSSITDRWLSNCDVPLNADLVAIIGNKGSGKSALADVIALLGNSKQHGHFSFLSNRRFRAKPKELAKHFTGRITWADGTTSERVLTENGPPESVELIRYIPQEHFERLCNDHVSGRSDVFESELRAVIFSHTSAAIRQDALDFDQLTEQQESSVRDRLSEYRKNLRRINQEIETIETQRHPDVRRSLEELLALKEKQIEEHQKLEPVVPPPPSDRLTAEQQTALNTLESVTETLRATDDALKTEQQVEAALSAKAKAIKNIRERLQLLKRQYKQFVVDIEASALLVDLTPGEVAQISANEGVLDAKDVEVKAQQVTCRNIVDKHEKIRPSLIAQQDAQKLKLNEPQQIYQRSLQAKLVWQKTLAELLGTSVLPETLEGLRARIKQLEDLPAEQKEKIAARLGLAGEIFDVLNAQRRAREELFAPVQELIHNNGLIRDEYKLQFQASLSGSSDVLARSLFELIKQNSGEFRGEDESYSAVRGLWEQFDLNKREDALQFAIALNELIANAAAANGKNPVGLTSILRVNKSSADVYDLLFGFPFLEPRYSLLFQDTAIEHLSPGQRGALLLIFYLLVDKGRNPIILDQPEENLDNETVVSLLVPVVTEAKTRRQILMVTHNPNLAVVCDAEQVVVSAFDRKDACTIKYVSGSIEEPSINKHVVNVLEGTKPAFNNRRGKYH